MSEHEQHPGQSTAEHPEQAFAELGRIVLGAQPLGEVLKHVARLAHGVLPDAADVSVTLLDEPAEGRPARRGAYTVAFVGDLAVDLDERQYEEGFGPCLDAAMTGETVVVDTGASQQQYPGFADAARRRGVGHSLSVGLPIAQRTIGALNVYGANKPFSDKEIQLAQAFAGYAAIALANASMFTNTADLARNLQAAMESRAVIEQAKGMVMVQRRCTADEAFDYLRTVSQQSNVKLRTLCQTMVDRAANGG